MNLQKTRMKSLVVFCLDQDLEFSRAGVWTDFQKRFEHFCNTSKLTFRALSELFENSIMTNVFFAAPGLDSDSGSE